MLNPRIELLARPRLFSGRLLLAILLVVVSQAAIAQTDPLPSWNDGAAKKSIVEFVRATTTPGSTNFVPPEERIAVFDNDGTLWAEQPLYFQAFFVFDRIRALAPQHPEWQTQEPFASILKGYIKTALAGGEHALLEMVMATHAGMTTDEFDAIVTDWISTAKHPTTGKLYTQMVYQPMLEVLSYLRASGFKTFIVSGGGIDFMRPRTACVYGIPPEQVVGIHQHIGHQPIIAFGNSDGDFQMLQRTTAGSGKRLGLFVHHDDAQREWGYDRQSSVGKLDKGLDAARKKAGSSSACGTTGGRSIPLLYRPRRRANV